jgi:hypothetical protein
MSTVVRKTKGFGSQRATSKLNYRRLHLRLRIASMLMWDARRRTPPRITLPALRIMYTVYDDTDPDRTRAKARR